MLRKLLNSMMVLALLFSTIPALALPGTLPAPRVPEPSSRLPTLRNSALQPPNGFIVSEPVLPVDTTGLPPAPPAEPYKGEEVFVPNGLLPKVQRLNNAPHTPDPAVQSSSGPVAMPTPSMNWDGIGNTGVQPPDTDGQVGPNHYVQIVNAASTGSQIRIWDKSGTQLYDFGMNGLWPAGDRCNTYGYGDPVVLYDQLADRWILTQFIYPPSGPYSECFAVSKAGTPTNNPSDWWLYNFVVHATNFPDYPKIGVWPDGYYMMAHQFANASTWAGSGVWVFDRDKMLNGQAATFQYKDLYPLNPNYGGLLPSNLMGNTLPPAGSPNYFVEVDQDWSGTDDVMTVFAFHTDWATPANTTFTVVGTFTVDPFDMDLCPASREQCIDQPGRPLSLEAIADRLMMHLWYRNFGDHEALVTNHTVDADGSGHAGIRWYELRKTTPAPTAWSIYQQGTYFPTSDHRWMGSIAMDHVGNMALGYSVSSLTTYPSIRYAGRLAGDPLGTLAQGEASLVEGGGSFSGYRWGDYSAMSVDPVDDCTFWYTQEYVKTGQTSWSTRVGSFKFPNCSIGPQGILAGVVTNSSGGALIPGATILATGSVTQSGGTQSGAGGAYALNLLTGSYVVTGTAYGFLPRSYTGVTINQNATTTLNIALDPAAAYVVSGTVKDALTGWPLYARLTIGGYPSAPIWTDPATGYYSVTLVGGTLYNFNVTAFSSGYQAASQLVGPLTSNMTVNIGLNADQTTCNAPGYGIVISGLYENFDSATPPALPAGWAKVVVTTTTTAADWATNAGTRYPSGQPAHSAPNLVYFNSFSSGSGGAARLYRTSDINMSTVPTTTLNLWMYHETAYTTNNDYLQVQVSTDGGTTWQNVGAPISRYDGSTQWKQHSVSLAAYAGQNIRLGLLGISAYGNDVHIDDVLLGTAPCLARSGGLVVGNVSDVNNGQPLNSTTVSNQGGYSTATVGTPADPNVADGFYTLFSPAGTQVFTATRTGYKTETANVTVPLSGTVRQNFMLGAGMLSYTPGAFNVSLLAGMTTTLPMTLNNMGNLAATFEIQEGDLGGVPLMPGEVRPPYKPRVKPYWDETETMTRQPVKGGGTPPLPLVWGTGASIPTGARYRAAGASCDGKTYYVFGGQNSGGTVLDETWQYDPATNAWTAKAAMPVALMSMESTCIDGLIYLVGGYTGSAHTNRFQIYDTANNTWVSSTWPNTLTPMTAAWNGKLYAFGGNPGPSAATWMYDPATATWTGPFASMPTATSYGAATTKDDYIYVVGGGATGAAQRYNPVANTWSSGPLLPAIRMNTMLVWYGNRLYAASGGGSGGDVWTAYNDTYWLDTSAWPGGSWTLQGEMVLQPVVAAAYDCVNNRIYGAGGTSGGSYYATNQYLDDGRTCHVGGAGADVLWVSESPVTGTVASLSSQVVNVTFDSGMVDPGVYKAGLKFKNNMPYLVPDMPLTLTVNVPPTWGKLMGKVSTLGYCDATPAALKNVTVTVQSAAGTWYLRTDQNGNYAKWFDTTNNPFTVTVNVTDYEAGLATGVNLAPLGTTTRDFNLRWLKPCLSASPASFTVDLPLGQNTWRPFKLTNAGAATAVYSMTEQPASGPTTPRPEGSTSANTSRLPGFHTPLAPAPFAPMADMVQDGSFEATNPTTYQNPYWTQGSTNFGTVICDVAGCGTGGGTAGPRTGAFWVWFGGSDTGDVGHIEQPVTFSGGGTLQFYLWIGASSGGASDWVRVSVDGRQVFQATGAQQESYNTYTLVTVNLSGFGVGSHVLRFDSTTIGSGNFNIDDVLLDATGGASVDVPWVSEIPVSGTVAADTFVNTMLLFDANAVPAPGTYQANVNVNSNDPQNPLRQVNLTLNVTAPANWGVLTGTISSLGGCGMDLAPLADATVVAQSSTSVTRTATSDGNGLYTLWLDSFANPYTLTVSAGGHQPSSASDVEIGGWGAATQRDLGLRAILPCVLNSPDGIVVTVPWQGAITQTLVLSNTGAASSLFTITEQLGSFVPARPVEPNASGGPDAFGYTFRDSNDAGGPTYEWIDATGGAALALPGDDDEVNITLPFAWKYYTTTSTALRVGKNGGVLFDATTGDVSWTNSAMSSTSDNMLALLWDDQGAAGTVYWQVFGTAPSRMVVIEWHNVPRFSNIGAATFELVLYENGNILYQYLDVDYGDTSYNGGASATVGLRGLGSANSLQYSYDTAALTNSLAICFAYPGQPTDCAADKLPWLTENPAQGALAADGGLQNVDLAFNANVPEVARPGMYYGRLRVKHDDVARGDFFVPVTMTVQPPASQGKLHGTVTGLGYCDVNPAPLNNANVLIQGGAGVSTTLTTNASGSYHLWLDAGTYTVTASMANYQTVVATGVPITGSRTITQNLDLRWLEPCVSATPSGLAVNLAMGMTATLPMTAINRGAVGTPFTITADSRGFIPLSPSPLGFVIFLQEGFESATFPPTSWTRINVDGSSTQWVRSTDYYNTGSASAYHGWGSSGTMEDGWLVSPPINIPADPTSLSFWERTAYPADYYSHTLYVCAGGSCNTPPTNYTFVAEYGDPTWNWRQQALNLDTYAGRTIRLAFRYMGDYADGWYLDDVLVQSAVGVIWLDESPRSGSLAADTGSQSVAVTFRADVPAVNQPGTYLATLNLLSNDPMHSTLGVPVTMTVNIPPDWGRLTGTVNTLGACDVNPAPLANARIVATGGATPVTFTTNSSGAFSNWFGAGTYRLTVSAADHQDAAVFVSVSAAQTTTQDVYLTWLRPCAAVAPVSGFRDNLAYGSGLSVTHQLVINNSGAGALNWTMQEKLVTSPPAKRQIIEKPQAAQAARSTQGGAAGRTAPIRLPSGNMPVLAEGFEGGVMPPAGWTRVVSNTGYTWKMMNSTPHSGSYAADVEYDPALSPQDEWLISPLLNVSNGVLSFWSFGSPYWCRDTYDNCDLDVWLVVGSVGGGDDIYVGRADPDWPAGAPYIWTQNVFTLTSLLPGSPVRIGFQYIGVDGAWIALDDISLDSVMGGVCLGNSVSWLSTSPVSGTTTAGGSSTVNVTVDSTGVAAGSHTANVCVQSDDLLQPTIEVPVTLNVVGPDVALTKTGPATAASDTIVYRIAYTNTGLATASAVTLVDTLPSGVTYGASSPSGTYNSGANTVTWNLGALAESAGGTVVLTVTKNAGLAIGAVLTNTATANVTPQDVATANNTSSVTTLVESSSNLGDSLKTVDKPNVRQGDVVTYTITLINTGNLTATVTVTDPIPSGVTYVLGSGSVNGAATGLYDDTADRIWWRGTIAPGGTVTLRFRAVVTALPGATVTNVALVNDGMNGVLTRQAVTSVVLYQVFLPLTIK